VIEAGVSPSHTRARIGAHGKHHPGEPVPDELARDHAAARIEQYVQRIVADAPPLTPEQRDRISTLLRPDRPTAAR
jgi:hypothetical protein